MLALKNEENRRIHGTDGKGKGQPQMFLGVMGALSHSSVVPSLGQLISQWTPGRAWQLQQMQGWMMGLEGGGEEEEEKVKVSLQVCLMFVRSC